MLLWAAAPSRHCRTSSRPHNIAWYSIKQVLAQNSSGLGATLQEHEQQHLDISSIKTVRRVCRIVHASLWRWKRAKAINGGVRGFLASLAWARSWTVEARNSNVVT